MIVGFFRELSWRAFEYFRVKLFSKQKISSSILENVILKLNSFYRRFLKKNEAKTILISWNATESSAICRSNLSHSLQTAKKYGKVHFTDPLLILNQCHITEACEHERIFLFHLSLLNRKLLLNTHLLYLNFFPNLFAVLQNSISIYNSSDLICNRLKLPFYYYSGIGKLFLSDRNQNIKSNHLTIYSLKCKNITANIVKNSRKRKYNPNAYVNLRHFRKMNDLDHDTGCGQINKNNPNLHTSCYIRKTENSKACFAVHNYFTVDLTVYQIVCFIASLSNSLHIIEERILGITRRGCDVKRKTSGSNYFFFISFIFHVKLSNVKRNPGRMPRLWSRIRSQTVTDEVPEDGGNSDEGPVQHQRGVRRRQRQRQRWQRQHQSKSKSRRILEENKEELSEENLIKELFVYFDTQNYNLVHLISTELCSLCALYNLFVDVYVYVRAKNVPIKFSSKILGSNFKIIFTCPIYKINSLFINVPQYSTGLVLVINLGERFSASIPMKPKSCDTSLYWLCRQNVVSIQKTLIYNTQLQNSTARNVTEMALNLSLVYFFPKRHFAEEHFITKISLNLGWLNNRHIYRWVCYRLCNDIEANPGPRILEDVNKQINIITLNCRGLGKIEKFRLTLKKAAEILKKQPCSIILLQETMIKVDSYLKIAWKGTYAITYGNGNSQGCITLADSNITFSNQVNFENRGHYVEVEGLKAKKVAVLNIYAPTGYANNKRDFFNEVIDMIENTRCEDIVMAGDFNITFGQQDRLGRNTCAGETTLAKYVSDRLDSLGMEDAWRGYTGMTWKRGNVMSRLDRIYAKLQNLKLASVITDWTMCDSDHAMVMATYISQNRKQNGPRICRLDPKVVFDNDSLFQLRQYLSEQLASLSNTADPHLRLEFAKMTIRTKALELGKILQNTESTNLKLLDEDIKLHERLLAEATAAEELEELGLHLERQTIERNRILESQGKNLAWKSRTKWYNEGEKSNKYFLNQLKANNKKTEMTKLLWEGQLLADPQQIEQVVNQYYHDLYNMNTLEIGADVNDSFLSKMFTLEEAEVNVISQPITLNELWMALKPLKDTAPGPDGISHIYLKKLWDIMGPVILDAWNYSIQNDKMPPSHERSHLRLIPKQGKDTLQLKNWRPITLSNCDHKLITRVYNTRLIKILGKHISGTQTAYIQNRNITDNIRLINTAIQLANCEPDINGSIIALDAQKAFDSVNHNYLKQILETIGLGTFVPIFNLLYKSLVNDMVINGQVIGNHSVRNGVKQGDALSCTLFILAIEPLIRNIEGNTNITAISSATLQFQWPKVLGYADDITCLVKNNQQSKQAVFTEYEKFSKKSGLILNADKTEMYDFSDTMRPANINEMETRVSYLGKEYRLQPLKSIKINGLILCKNMQLQKKLNCEILIEKMDKHFAGWSRRNLSLLGKIQIYKTFGLSQFLYHLAVIEPDAGSWKEINNKIAKFLWNRNYMGNQAPARIKKEILLTPVSRGGFGLVDVKEVVTALRLKRHFYHLEQRIHPMAFLLNKLLEDTDYLSAKPGLNIDEITNQNMTVLREKRLSDCVAPDWQLENDLYLHSSLIHTKVLNITRPKKRQSAEMAYLRRNNIATFADAINNGGRNLTTLVKIASKELTQALRVISDRYRGIQLPQENVSNKIKDNQGRWVNAQSLTSRLLREILFYRQVTNPKTILIEEDCKARYYYNLSKLVSTSNKSRILRLLYGDVYCGERLVRSGFSESDSCRRCFEKETIMHLLADCPYTRAIYQILSIDSDDPTEVLGINLNKAALEIRCDLINYLVFQQKRVPPKILVQSLLEKFANGLVNKQNVKRCAENMLKEIARVEGQGG